MTATTRDPIPPTAGRARDVVPLDDDRARRLRLLNVVMGLAHAASATAMVVLGNDFSLPVTSLNRAGPPGTPLAEWTPETVVDVRLAWGTAGFLALSALFHLLVASPIGFGSYLAELRRGRNRFRWVEYSLSATLMIVLIAQLTGMSDLGALIGVGFANVAMILFGWVMEVVNAPGRGAWWTPFWFGCIAGAGPWLAIGVYLAVNVSGSSQGPPGFVYGIIVSLFVLFNCFALNQVLQYRARGRWADYVFGEIVYVVLSITAKSALAWQVFANVLIDQGA